MSTNTVVAFPPYARSNVFVYKIGDWEIGEAINVGFLWSTYGYYRYYQDNSKTGNVVRLGDFLSADQAIDALEKFNQEQLARTKLWRSLPPETLQALLDASGTWEGI